jgi:ABC-type transporter Mla maintaining outer membrane lipid asymmetry ATPase subunit MlaF
LEACADPIVTTNAAEAVIEIRNLRKGHPGPRPILVAELDVRAGDIVAIAGLDEPAAELFVSLITGAALPDAGEVRVFGTDTRAISTHEQWLTWLENFGIVSERAALVAALTVAQNIAVPLTLDLFPLSDEMTSAVQALAIEAGVAPEALDRPAGETAAEVQARARLARALAANPSLLLLEHPSAALEPPAASALAADIAKLSRARRLTVLALTNDRRFGRALAGRLLALEPTTGKLRDTRLSLRRFRGRDVSS